MAKMAVMPIYGKNLFNSSSPKPKTDDLETLYTASGTQAQHSLYNEDPGWTLNFFRASSNLLSNASVLESKTISNDQELIQSDPTSCPQNQKGNGNLDFSETTDFYDLKIGTCSLLSEYMKT